MLELTSLEFVEDEQILNRNTLNYIYLLVDKETKLSVYFQNELVEQLPLSEKRDDTFKVNLSLNSPKSFGGQLTEQHKLMKFPFLRCKKCVYVCESSNPKNQKDINRTLSLGVISIPDWLVMPKHVEYLHISCPLDVRRLIKGVDRIDSLSLHSYCEGNDESEISIGTVEGLLDSVESFLSCYTKAKVDKIIVSFVYDPLTMESLKNLRSRCDYLVIELSGPEFLQVEGNLVKDHSVDEVRARSDEYRSFDEKTRQQITDIFDFPESSNITENALVFYPPNDIIYDLRTFSAGDVRSYSVKTGDNSHIEIKLG